jgi:hypothetical protein
MAVVVGVIIARLTARRYVRRELRREQEQHKRGGASASHTGAPHDAAAT